MDKPSLKQFLRMVGPQLVVFFGTIAVFTVIYILARLPLTYFAYALQLLAVLFLLYLLYQWFRYRQRFAALQKLQETTPYRLEDFPDSTDPADEWYHRKILAMSGQLKEQAATEAERRSEQLDYFTLWLHQIKTPLAALNLLVKRSETEGSEMKQAEQELLRLEDYTHMALNYVKLEEAGADLELYEADVDEIIKKAVKKYSILFIYKGISLDYEPTGIRALTDAKWLQVMLEQILSNSLKYTPSGTITIRKDLDNDQSFCIEDTGIGIRQEDLPRIFNKGYSGLNGRLHEKSTGLGLFLVRKICSRLGHRISIQAEPGQGTKVEVDLSREAIGPFD